MGTIRKFSVLDPVQMSFSLPLILLIIESRLTLSSLDFSCLIEPQVLPQPPHFLEMPFLLFIKT
jgi:hypothetical protein